MSDFSFVNMAEIEINIYSDISKVGESKYLERQFGLIVENPDCLSSNPVEYNLDMLLNIFTVPQCPHL